MKYHSALHKPSNYPALDKIQLGNSVAFTHDVMKGIPKEYEKCDIIYIEIPWIDGFQIFEERANIKQQRTYEEFMVSVSDFVTNLKKPTIVITGKKGLKYLPKLGIEAGTVLNGAPCRLMMYNTTVSNLAKCITILEELSLKYNCIGDPCCGFGRSAKAFKQAGKQFIVSDYNAECIGYIAQEWANW